MSTTLTAAAPRHGMTCLMPATYWEDALPVGNGVLGAMVYGNLKHELILVNHEDLWFRTAKPILPDVAEHLPELRRLLAEGQFAAATNFLAEKMTEAGLTKYRVDGYHPAFDVALDTATGGAFRDYRRSLDFATGVATVSWREGETVFCRETFASRGDDVIVLRIRASRPGAVNVRVALIPHEHREKDVMGARKVWAAGDPAPIEFAGEAADGSLWITGRYTAPQLVGGEFGGVARVVLVGAGTMVAKDNGVVVEHADEVLVLVSAFANEASATARPRLEAELAALAADGDALLARHVALHRRLFGRTVLDLGGGRRGAGRSNEDLLLDAYREAMPVALVEKLFDYGRYLLIASSRPGGWPANLQGIWNGDYRPAWESDIHNDENIQMNYWPALPGNLAETTLPYFDYFDRSLPDFRENARKIFGCRGIFVPISQSTHGLTWQGPWINWTAGAGWLAQLYFDYYLFTGDVKFLRERAVPFLREVALFYEDFLVPGPDGKLLFSPSLSPENIPDVPGGALATVNATMDVAVAREVLTNLLRAAETLGEFTEEAGRWRQMLDRLPDYVVNADGAMCEWLDSRLKDNYHHRHQSHIYPVFPGCEVTEESHPELFRACQVAVEKRLVIGLTSQTGWSFAHMANIFARLGDGERLHQCLDNLARSCLGPNLFTYHNDWRSQGMSMFWGYGNWPPFQIDANFGVAAAIIEMLVFSAPGMLKLLPALPARFAKGAVRGIRARGGLRVALKWDLKKGTLKAGITAAQAQALTVKLPFTPIEVAVVGPVAVHESGHGPQYRELRFGAPGTAALEVTFAKA